MEAIKILGSRLYTYWKNAEKPSVIEWIAWGTLCIFSMFTFIYGDVIVTSYFSVECIDSLLNGKLMDFYQITLDQPCPLLSDPAVYDLPIYLIFGILDIPLLIYSRIYGMDNMATNSPVCLVWIKLTLLFFVIGTAIVIFKLCKELGISEKNSKWSVWLFLTSVHLIMPAIVLSQYDIICVFFMMLAWLAYLKNNKTGFYLCFAVAITLKLFALFVFVPLVLLKEKRVLYVAIELLKGCSLWIFFKLLFHYDMGYRIATGSFMEDMSQKLAATSLGVVGLVGISVFAVIYFGVCIIAYMVKTTEKVELSKWFFYLSFIVFGAFSLFCVINPYWAILYVPFAILLLFMKSDKFKINLFLEMFMAFALLICLVNTTPWVYSSGIVKPTYFARWIVNENPQYGAVAELLDKFGLVAYLPVFAGMAVACFISIVVINIPKKGTINDSLNIERSVVWSRFGLALLIPALILYVYIVPAKICIVDTSSGDVAEEYYNICQTEAEQEISFSSDAILDRLEIDVMVSDPPLLRNASLMVEILDKNTREVITSDRIPYNDIVKSNIAVVSLNGIRVYEGEAYIIRLFSLNATAKGYVAPLITEGKVLDGDMKINDMALNATCSMRIYAQ